MFRNDHRIFLNETTNPRFVNDSISEDQQFLKINISLVTYPSKYFATFGKNPSMTEKMWFYHDVKDFLSSVILNATNHFGRDNEMLLCCSVNAPNNLTMNKTDQLSSTQHNKEAGLRKWNIWRLSWNHLRLYLIRIYRRVSHQFKEYEHKGSVHSRFAQSPLLLSVINFHYLWRDIYTKFILLIQHHIQILLIAETCIIHVLCLSVLQQHYSSSAFQRHKINGTRQCCRTKKLYDIASSSYKCKWNCLHWEQCEYDKIIVVLIGFIIMSQCLHNVTRANGCKFVQSVNIKKHVNIQNYFRNDSKSSFSFYFPNFLFSWHNISPTFAFIYPLNHKKKPYFSEYMHRLGSFKATSNYIPLPPHKLASAGFYSTGNPNETKCYYCGISYSNWKHGDDPNKIHISLYPRCGFLYTVTSQDECDDSSNHSRYPGKESRVHSETNLPSRLEGQINSETINGRTLVNGHTASGDTIETHQQDHCVSENVNGNNGMTNRSHKNKVNNRSSENDRYCLPTHSLSEDQYPSNTTSVPNGESGPDDTLRNGHRESRPETDMVANRQGVYNDRPRYPAYAVLTVRISSFQGWPSHPTQTPRVLALAGFLYVGTFYVTLFICVCVQFVNKDENDIFFLKSNFVLSLSTHYISLKWLNYDSLGVHLNKFIFTWKWYLALVFMSETTWFLWYISINAWMCIWFAFLSMGVLRAVWDNWRGTCAFVFTSNARQECNFSLVCSKVLKWRVLKRQCTVLNKTKTMFWI